MSISSVADAFGVATVTVTVDDGGAFDNLAMQSFVLTVDAVNDAPNFALSAAAVVLDEDFATIQAISVVSSDDGDGTSQSLSYSISTTAVGFATLLIDGSGTVSISSVADAFGVATVTVTVDDGGAVDNLAMQSFVLTVNAVNDAPNFALSAAAVVLDEDFATTQAISVVSSDDGDGTSQSLSYHLSNVGFATLLIDGSGTVSISSVADAFGVATVTVTVVDDGGSSSTQSFVLTVNAVNDAPSFTLSTAALSLAEDFGSTQITVTSSDDGDATEDQLLSYSLSSSNVGFAQLSVDGSGTVSISSVADAFGVATVTVTVDDGGAIDNLAMQSFVLTVNAVNDAPNFALSAAAVVLDEDFATTQAISVVSSDDGDGTSQSLSYHLSYVGFATLLIDGSGTVSISSVADAFGVATVTVTVVDDGGSSSTQSFVLTVNAVNDAPSFTLSTAALSLAEDFGSAQITVTSSDDGDATEDQLLSYSLSSSNVGFAQLSVDGSGTVSISSVADAFGVATVTVTVDDGGAVDNLAMQSFVLTVDAVNDAPNFALSAAAVVLDEDFATTQAISVVSSDDGDGTSQSLSYSLSTSHVGFATLLIDGSGTVSISSVADGFGVVTVTVTVDDGGAVDNLAMQSFVLTVNAVNDAPSFTLSTAALSLAEDFGITQVTVTSSDDGDGTSQSLSYSISTTAVGFATLSIDGSGTVSISSVADAFGVATVTVTVDDGGSTDSRSSTQSFTLTVNNVNDAPNFALSAAALSLAEDFFGSTQVTVASSDDGDGTSQSLSYSISTTAVGFATLSIDGSGTVSISSVADAFGVATVTVTVDDGGAVDNLAMQSFVLTVNAVNDAPSFTLSTAALSLAEDFGSTQVTVISSDDGDATEDQLLSYSLSSSNVGFATLSIDGSGTVSISSVADAFGVATVTVTVDDGGSTDSRSSTQSFTLTVNNVNDAPNFALSAAALSLAEDFFGSTQVTVASSDDGDGTSQSLSYSISTTAVGFATLSIDGSGTVSISSVADAFGVATVTVTVDDGGAVDNLAMQSFVLTVNAVNDAPSFTLSTAALSLAEDFGSTQVTVISSDDGDATEDQLLSYSLSSSNVGFAQLSVDGSGTVSISSVADAFGVATVTVTVDDGGAFDNLAMQSFVLTVDAVNDAPNFALSAAAVVLDEDFATIQAISVVSSDDGDGTSQSLSYSISTTAVGFATLLIDGSGTVSISSVADAFGVATVTVTVDDGGAVDNLAMQSFVLTVNAVNDAPSFTLSTAALSLAEDFGSTQVTVISSDDGDATEDQLLSYSLSSSNVGFAQLSVDGSGTVSISSVADAFGVATVTVTVDDGGSTDSRSTQSFTLTVNNVNDAPNFALSTAALSLAEDFGSTQVTVASSDDGDGTSQSLSYSISTTAVGLPRCRLMVVVW